MKLAFFTALCMLGLSFGGSAQETPRPEATLIIEQGSVMTVRAGAYQKAKSGQSVRAGESVLLKDGAIALVVFDVEYLAHLYPSGVHPR